MQADYSCALKLATPVAFKSTISKAGHEGIMIKGAKSIEALNSADTFIFDKTGTLTKNEMEVTNMWNEKEYILFNDANNTLVPYGDIISS